MSLKDVFMDAKHVLDNPPQFQTFREYFSPLIDAVGDGELKPHERMLSLRFGTMEEDDSTDLFIETSWTKGSGREPYRLPLECLSAPDPVHVAKVYGLKRRIAKAEDSVTHYYAAYRNSSDAVTFLQTQLAELEKK